MTTDPTPSQVDLLAAAIERSWHDHQVALPDGGLELAEEILAALQERGYTIAAPTPTPEPETDLYIGPIQHSDMACGPRDCTCWCAGCENHNRHREWPASKPPEPSNPLDEIEARLTANGRLNETTMPETTADLRYLLNVARAARLPRNVLIPADSDPRFIGEWIAVPRQDFDALRDALEATHDR